MSAEQILKWRLLPRGMMVVMTFMAWRCVEWYMGLPDPSIEQSGFVSVVMGAMTGSFAIWMGNENKGIK
jgi:hypothetical protein